jgi:hypothetical protein
MAAPQQPDKNTALVTEKGQQTPILIDWFTKITVYIKGLVPGTRLVNTTAPLAGGGALSANLTLSITGYSGTIITAKLTPGGANGSMTFSNGVLTAQLAAT